MAQNSNKHFSFFNDRVTFIASVISIISVVISALLFCYTHFTQHNINGTWKLTFYIESSTLKRYVGMNSGNKIIVHLDGKNFVAKGEKFWINNKRIPIGQHSRIELQGTVEGSLLIATYELYGEKRTTVGGVRLNIENNDRMIGTFTGTAGDTKGKAIAERME